MTDQTLISDLIEAGVASQLVARVSNALVSVAVRGRSVDATDAKLVKDRERKRVERENLRISKGSAKANDVAASAPVPEPVHGPSTDSADKHHNLLTSLSSFETLESKKESIEKEKKVRGSVVTRGIRIVPDQQITEADWRFAIDAGMTPAAAKHAWAEFVDYWSGVSGQRGVRLGWSGTWRNRVRELIKRGAPRINGQGYAPRPGSREDRQEKTANALAKLTQFIENGPDGQAGGGYARSPTTGFLSFDEPSRS